MGSFQFDFRLGDALDGLQVCLGHLETLELLAEPQLLEPHRTEPRRTPAPDSEVSLLQVPQRQQQGPQHPGVVCLDAAQLPDHQPRMGGHRLFGEEFLLRHPSGETVDGVAGSSRRVVGFQSGEVEAPPAYPGFSGPEDLADGTVPTAAPLLVLRAADVQAEAASDVFHPSPEDSLPPGAVEPVVLWSRLIL